MGSSGEGDERRRARRSSVGPPRKADPRPRTATRTRPVARRRAEAASRPVSRSIRPPERRSRTTVAEPRPTVHALPLDSRRRSRCRLRIGRGRKGRNRRRARTRRRCASSFRREWRAEPSSMTLRLGRTLGPDEHPSGSGSKVGLVVTFIPVVRHKPGGAEKNDIGDGSWLKKSARRECCRQDVGIQHAGSKVGRGRCRRCLQC